MCGDSLTKTEFLQGCVNVRGWRRRERQESALCVRKAHGMNSTAGSPLASEALAVPSSS